MIKPEHLLLMNKQVAIDKHYIMNSVFGGKGNIALIHKDDKQYSKEKYEHWSELSEEIDKKYIVGP